MLLTVLFSSFLATLALFAAIEPATSATTAKISLSPSEASAGETVTTARHNFPARSRGSITFGGDDPPGTSSR